MQTQFSSFVTFLGDLAMVFHDLAMQFLALSIHAGVRPVTNTPTGSPIFYYFYYNATITYGILLRE